MTRRQVKKLCKGAGNSHVMAAVSKCEGEERQRGGGG